MRIFLRAVVPAIILSITWTAATPLGTARAQTRAERVLAQMSDRQRVGQLFLVPFQGRDVGDGSEIAALIDELGIGGVLLSPERDNFRNEPDGPAQVATLTRALQARAGAAVPAVPLWIAMDAQTGVRPGSPLWAGMSPRPSAMSLGATWQPEHARRTAEIEGRELSLVGVNLLLGPSLDVLAVPRPGSTGDLGTRSFGGNPAWVARFGRSFIEGATEGSAGRLAIAAGSFPGVGGADRSQAQELPLVDSAAADLQALELVPFVAAADRSDDGDAAVDAFRTAHVRYRGIQRQVDRPLSLDSGGLGYLFAQVPVLGDWRREGGVLVSGGLGLPSVRGYVDPDLETFNARRVVREALLAGNDVLTLTGFTPPGGGQGGRTVRDTVEWLVSAYEQDETMRDAVDAAALRILALKLRTIDSADGSPGPPSIAEIERRVGEGREVVTAVARDALTLLAPPAPQAALPSPQRGDRILYVVDARSTRECEDCPAELLPNPARFVSTTLNVYGPGGAGTARVERESHVAAITYRDLRAWMAARGRLTEEDNPSLVAPLEPDRDAEVDGLLRLANWLVFAQLDVRAEAPASDALKLFLRDVQAEGAQQRLVAIALDAPYFLDTTEIAKLTAYFGLYSPTEAFIDVAVRSLFGDETPSGASPVSVPGVGYELSAQLAPSTDQDVTLSLPGRDAERPVSLGDSFRARTSPLLDGNGNVVPDGTRVTFRGYDPAEDVYLRDTIASTLDGVAETTLAAERTGELELRAVLDNGLASDPLVVRIEDQGVTPEPDPVGEIGQLLVIPRAPVDWSILLLSLTMVLLAGLVVFGTELDAVRAPSRMLRLFLLSMAWGLAGYLLMVAGGLRLSALPGGWSIWPDRWRVAYQAPVVSFVFALLPVVPAVLRAVLRTIVGRRTVPPPD